MASSAIQHNVADLYLDGAFPTPHQRQTTIHANGYAEPNERNSFCISPAYPSQQLAIEPVQRSASASAMTVAGFVEHFFVPEYVAMKKLSGQAHFQAILKHVVGPEEVDRMFRIGVKKSQSKLKAIPGWPYLRSMRLRDVNADDVQRLISAALQRGYSTQTAMHIRNVLSAIFEHARKTQCLGENPARLIKLPRMPRQETPSLTLAQAQEVLAVMHYPEKELSLFVMLTGMYVAEICGLQWKHVNLKEDWSTTGDEAIPPSSIAITKAWRLGELDNLYRESRKRNLAIPESLLPVLVKLSQRPKFTGPDDFVLVSPKGSAVNGATIAAHRLKSIGKNLQMPWLSWHVFQRTRTKLINELGRQSLCSF